VCVPRQSAYGDLPLTVSLQDRLGELNDCATAQQRLQHWLEQSNDPEEMAYLPGPAQRRPEPRGPVSRGVLRLVDREPRQLLRSSSSNCWATAHSEPLRLASTGGMQRANQPHFPA